MPRRNDVLARLGSRSDELVDARSPEQYSGHLISLPGCPQEGAQREGHIPEARSIPFAQGVRDDGTFTTADEGRKVYDARGIDGGRPVTSDCLIGGRSRHSWFVLRELLGVRHVRNGDGSWTERGNSIGVPIATV